MPKQHENQANQNDHQKSYSINERRFSYRAEGAAAHHFSFIYIRPQNLRRRPNLAARPTRGPTYCRRTRAVAYRATNATQIQKKSC
jgi:hypothetical protein